MSKLDSISTQIIFEGDDIINVLEKNWLIHDAVWKHAKQHINAKIAVYTSERPEPHGPVEWAMSITSPAGRQTFSISQRTPTGTVSFTKG